MTEQWRPHCLRRLELKQNDWMDRLWDSFVVLGFDGVPHVLSSHMGSQLLVLLDVIILDPGGNLVVLVLGSCDLECISNNRDKTTGACDKFVALGRQLNFGHDSDNFQGWIARGNVIVDATFRTTKSLSFQIDPIVLVGMILFDFLNGADIVA
jgi:hypothetical protein